MNRIFILALATFLILLMGGHSFADSVAKDGKVGDLSVSTLSMLGDLVEKLKSGNITSKQLEAFLKDACVKPEILLAEWQDFWKRHGIDQDLSGVAIPEKKKGFDRLIVIPARLSLNLTIFIMNKKFRTWTYSKDPDNSMTENDRTTEKAYAIWVRDRIKADMELKSLSADDLSERGISGITLLERLAYELKYFDETGEHLDEKTLTLCSGSRDKWGRIPYVGIFSDDEVGVQWVKPTDAGVRLRSRAVVAR